MSKSFTVSEAFEPPVRGNSLFTRAYMRSHAGDYPVYSGATTGPIGSIDTYELEGDYLSWSTDGYAGRLMVNRGKFSGTSHRAFLRPKIPGINLEYCRLVLSGPFREAARGRLQDGQFRNEYTALPLQAVASIEFSVPTDADGNIDEEAQADFVTRSQRATAFQDGAEALIRELTQATALPSLSDASDVREVSLTDPNTFTFLKRETGWLKKHWIRLAKEDGTFPVFSAAKAPVAFVDEVTPKLIEASEDDLVLSFGVDGDGSAGTNFVIHDRPFYISTNRTSLKPQSRSVSVLYLYYALQTMKADHGFSYTYKAYPSRLADVMVPLPIDEDGTFDLPVQLAEVERLRKLNRLREEVVEVLSALRSAALTTT